MTINEHITEFAGLPVREFDPDGEPPADPGAVAWRLSVDWDSGVDGFEQRFAALAGSVWADRIRALVVGMWGDTQDENPAVSLLKENASRFTSLTAVFLAEMTYEEQEISWIQQCDVTPVLTAYPGLEVLTVRGADGLEVSPVRHERLRELTLQSGGLPATVVRGVGDCDLPALTHLELWLGTDNYGGDATVEDLAPILAGTRLPALRSLGLRDAELADEVAAALAGAPVVARLERLDLSLGVLSDVGAAALLAGQPLTHLRELDLHHHFIGKAVTDRLRGELEEAGVAIDLTEDSDAEGDDRYIAVSE
jgi:hypothetical protein